MVAENGEYGSCTGSSCGAKEMKIWGTGKMRGIEEMCIRGGKGEMIIGREYYEAR